MLCALERLALYFPPLAAYLVWTHKRAFQRLALALGPAPRITIIGGALFPRTLLALRQIFPDGVFSIVDSNAGHIHAARKFPEFFQTNLVHNKFYPERHHANDLLVLPLAYIGDKQDVFISSEARLIVSHDWIWRRHGSKSTIVSWFLLKRLNLVIP